MFGSDANKNDNSATATTGTSMIGRDNPNTPVPVPPPDTSIAPMASANTGPAPSYLEGNPPGPSTPVADTGNTFLETGSGSLPTKPGKSAPMGPPPSPVSDDLTKIKQQALQSLAPLIDKLDQPPEERFKTLMMMIQASDNPEYIDEAYSAANGISDEKEKAQALLDIVNEINYFTQNSVAGSGPTS